MSLLDNVKNKDDYLGAGQFHWFTGVIEDVNDPEQRGRYKVRCWGYHTERKDYVAAVQLPWAHVMMPVTSASQCGVGESATGLLRGSWVVGFFRDGPSAQDPIIMGSLPSMTTTVDYDFGFCDPCEEYPYADKIDEPDTPEEAISKDDKFRESFSYLKKEEHRELTPVDIAFGGIWELPPVDEVIKVEYPKNHVKAWERELPVVETPDTSEETDGILEETPEIFVGDEGEEPEKEMHVQEFDVTPGWERISTMHKCGTYKEWTADGEEHCVIETNERRIIKENQHIYVMGNCTLTVDGNLHTLVKGDKFTHVKGNHTELIEGNLCQTILCNEIHTVLMNEVESIGMNEVHSVGMNIVENNMMFKSAFTGMTSLETTGINKNLITMRDNVANAMGSLTTTVADTWTELRGGMHFGVFGESRNEVVLDSSFEFTRREYLEVSMESDFSLLAAGTLSCGAGGVQANFGAPVTVCGHLPFVCP